MSLRKGFILGVVVALLVGFLGVPPVVRAEIEDEPTGTEITFDLVLVRPIGVVVFAAGTTIFIVSSPFALITGSLKNTADKLVAEPYRFTFVRPLGEY